MVRIITLRTFVRGLIRIETQKEAERTDAAEGQFGLGLAHEAVVDHRAARPNLRE